MRRNNQLIEQSELLATIVEKIENTYAEDISLLICYGSYITGSYGTMSDIDFFFVPRTQRGYELGYQFILDGIGYDLWSVSWERLTRISNLEEKIVSILMDGEVLFASCEDDLLRLEGLKEQLKQSLNDQSVIRKISLRYLENAKAIYFDLQNHAGALRLTAALNAVESLLFAIAILNGAYTRKGVKRIKAELDRFPLKPAGFLETYEQLTRTGDKGEVQRLVRELIVETDKLWKAKFESEEEIIDASELVGFYEEFKSIYNKLLLACDEKDYGNAYYAAFLVDRETQSFLNHVTGSGAYPSLVDEVLRNDFGALRANCIEHERRLIELLNRNCTEIHTFSSIEEFRRRFLEKTA